MSYEPKQDVVANYADLLINFALNGGEGIKPGEVAMLVVPDVAKSFLRELRNAVLRAGGHPISRLYPTGISKDYYELANEEQLTFFPRDYEKARAELIDHTVSIIAEPDPHELKDVDPKKIFQARDARKEVREWLVDKENRGAYTWTLALWGTEGMAAEAKLGIEEYWNQIIQGCYLDEQDPIAAWKKIHEEQIRVRKALDEMSIEWVHVEGENIDLKLKLGAERAWNGGSGRNIPSFEIFTSPDWRGTEGYIYFNQPLYRYGNLIKDVRLTFENGIVTKVEASQGQELVETMVKSENADKVGEFSLTDGRVSRITQFMANTLFDENMGGRYGNTHIAIGQAYKDCFKGNPAEVSKQEWQEMGYNESPEHTDIISTEDRKVTATTQDGSEVVIYQDGKFQV